MSNQAIQIQFLDEGGYAPLPPGIQVNLVPIPVSSATITGWIGVGGIMAVVAPVATNYTATFSGYQAPKAACGFMTSSDPTKITVVVVSAYRSPANSTLSLAQEGTLALPQGWYSADALAPGGVAWSLLAGIGGALALEDTNVQTALSAVRMQTAAGPALDSWAADYLDDVGARYFNESDDEYRRFVTTLLSTNKVTIDGIFAIVTAFFDAINAFYRGYSSQMSLHVGGPLGIAGGLGVSIPEDIPTVTPPQIAVFDQQSSPPLAARYHIVPPEFVVYLNFSMTGHWAFTNDISYLGFSTYLTGGPPTTLSPAQMKQFIWGPALVSLVNAIKGEGTVPLYVVERVFTSI